MSRLRNLSPGICEINAVTTPKFEPASLLGVLSHRSRRILLHAKGLGDVAERHALHGSVPGQAREFVDHGAFQPISKHCGPSPICSTESEDCKAQRQAIFAAVHLKSIPIAFESMCAIKTFREAVARTNEPQCAQTIAERTKNAQKTSETPPPPVATRVAFAPTPRMTAADCLNAAPAD